MSLELKDVKPGDLLCYGNNWYILIVQDQQGNNKNLKYVFLGGGPSQTELIMEAVEKSWPVVKV